MGTAAQAEFTEKQLHRLPFSVIPVIIPGGIRRFLQGFDSFLQFFREGRGTGGGRNREPGNRHAGKVKNEIADGIGSGNVLRYKPSADCLLQGFGGFGERLSGADFRPEKELLGFCSEISGKIGCDRVCELRCAGNGSAAGPDAADIGRVKGDCLAQHTVSGTGKRHQEIQFVFHDKISPFLL